MRKPRVKKLRCALKLCREWFIPKTGKQTFCSKECRRKHFNIQKQKAIDHWNRCELAKKEREAENAQD